ncbi:tetratricopeptide repeat protein [Arcobacter sp.]|uniref:tetratricopeptide repeat protein n=1 Tax=Arcobacter sp. TaxID=1872629 RepID=UPI003C72DC1E
MSNDITKGNAFHKVGEVVHLNEYCTKENEAIEEDIKNSIVKYLILILILINTYAQEVELKKSDYDITQCIKIEYTKEDIKNYKKLIEEGELQGYSCAGIYYARKGNFDEAINYFNKGKEKGSIEEYAQLGSLYSSFLHDKKKAVENYKIAANAGHGKSAHNLGVYYYRNFKYDKAYEWFWIDVYR